MSSITTPTWNIPPHTRVKHEILERYLSAWIPILARNQSNLLYIDGFAGPGRYSNGEDGSPIIALHTALKYRNKFECNIRLLFVEKDEKRAEVLEQNLSQFSSFGRRIKYDVKSGIDFQSAWQDIAREYRLNNQSLPPTFAFIDPFGWKDIPLSVLKQIMNNSRCEVFITFMYEEINRFIELPNQEENFDALFGTSEWKQIIARNNYDRKRAIVDLYRRQLQSEAAKYVFCFEMKNINDTAKYFLFYATNNLKGVQKMKESMWQSDPSGRYRFSDADDPSQGELFDRPDYGRLRQLILDKFVGSTVTIREIENFVLAETPYRETHYKRQVLRELENADPPRIEVMNPLKGRNKGTFSSLEMKIRFIPKDHHCMDRGLFQID